MALLVHLADARTIRSIRRRGLRGERRAFARDVGVEQLGRAVFSVPVTRSFFLTHQWLRELRRRGHLAFVAVLFRIADEERVLFGRYNRPHAWMTAAEAVAAFCASDGAALGAELVVPRAIQPTELHAIHGVRQVTGWRYYPEAHGRAPCPCEYCTRGAYGGRRLRERAATLRG